MTEETTQQNDESPFKGFTVHDSGMDPAEATKNAELAEATPAEEPPVEEPPTEEAPAEEPPAEEAPAEEPPAEEDPDDAGADDGEAAPKKKLSVSERIKQVVKARGVEERRANAAEAAAAEKDARIAELESQLTEKDAGGTEDSDTSSDGAGKPDPADFEYGELDANYTEALTDWKVDQKLAKRDEAQETTRQQEAAQEEAAELTAQYETALSNGIEAYPDFEAVVREGADADDYPLTEDTVRLALTSEVGHHVLYEIASDLPLAQKLAKMPPLMQAREFGRLEAQYAQEGAPSSQPNRATRATPPPTPRSGGKGAQPFNPNGSFKDFESKVMGERRSKR